MLVWQVHGWGCNLVLVGVYGWGCGLVLVGCVAGVWTVTLVRVWFDASSVPC